MFAHILPTTLTAQQIMNHPYNIETAKTMQHCMKILWRISAPYCNMNNCYCIGNIFIYDIMALSALTNNDQSTILTHIRF